MVSRYTILVSSLRIRPVREAGLSAGIRRERCSVRGVPARGRKKERKKMLKQLNAVRFAR